jgi:tRNA U54 and U55 pseudouridine synthase Pus10
VAAPPLSVSRSDTANLASRPLPWGGRRTGKMKLSKTVKEDIARKAATAMIAKKRDTAYETLRKELTAIAERQFANVPVRDMKKYGEYIEFTNHLKSGKGYPDGFIDVEGRNKRQYEAFGFVSSSDIPLLKQFPCKVCEYSIKVCDEYADDYIKAVRKYMLLYFRAVENYKLILESLNTVSSDKMLADNFPELLIFYTIEDDDNKRLVPIEKLNRCKALLRESRHLFLESI